MSLKSSTPIRLRMVTNNEGSKTGLVVNSLKPSIFCI
ncbi:hypothetical protein EVA_16016 [gut metagenome]|uniref:Uncharacterized protein n=1 Tax=gut metagenome TaxID=749906 RepID=J9G235_9ZZZZ